MYCPGCGTEIDENLSYCPKCGKKIRETSVISEEPPVPKYVVVASEKKSNWKEILIIVLALALILAVIFSITAAIRGSYRSPIRRAVSYINNRETSPVKLLNIIYLDDKDQEMMKNLDSDEIEDFFDELSDDIFGISYGALSDYYGPDWKIKSWVTYAAPLSIEELHDLDANENAEVVKKAYHVTYKFLITGSEGSDTDKDTFTIGYVNHLGWRLLNIE